MGEHVVSGEDKHSRLSGLHMHEFEGKQGFKIAESIRKRLRFPNSMAAAAGVTVEVDELHFREGLYFSGCRKDQPPISGHAAPSVRCKQVFCDGVLRG